MSQLSCVSHLSCVSLLSCVIILSCVILYSYVSLLSCVNNFIYISYLNISKTIRYDPPPVSIALEKNWKVWCKSKSELKGIVLIKI